MLRHCHLSIAAVGALSLALAACGKSPPPDPRTQPPLVRTTLVAPGNAPERVFTGTIAARVQGDLGFRVAGKVLERLVDTGQTVRRGQALLRLDPDRKSTRLNSSHLVISYAVFCLKKK